MNKKSMHRVKWPANGSWKSGVLVEGYLIGFDSGRAIVWDGDFDHKPVSIGSTGFKFVNEEAPSLAVKP